MTVPAKKDVFIVTISGDLGGGKSVLANHLIEHYKAQRYSTGTVQRKLAQQLGITTLELNQRAETDSSIDDQIDGVFKSLSETKDILVVDSRMAWHFLPQSFKIKLEIAPEIAAKRISQDNTRIGEGDTAPEVILKSILDRKHSETERFKRYYGVDITDQDNYDFVVYTHHADPAHIAKKTIEAIEQWRNGQTHHRHYIAPSVLRPTITPQEANDDASEDISIIKDGYCHYIVGGHSAYLKAMDNQTALVPVKTSEKPYNGQDLQSAWERHKDKWPTS
jgi:cytidylate kinase